MQFLGEKIHFNELKKKKKTEYIPILLNNMKDDVTPSKKIPKMSCFNLAHARGMVPNYGT